MNRLNQDTNLQNYRDLTENKTLYAKWIAITYEVTLVKNGGSGGTDSFKVTYDSALPTNLVAPKRMGYFFEGYYSENNGNGTCYINSQMKCEQDWNFTQYMYADQLLLEHQNL